MFGIWNKKNYEENEYVDPSVFYFEASLYRQWIVKSNGTQELKT